MTVNELVFDSLENFESMYIDYGEYTKELNPALYEAVENIEVAKWYLDIKDNKPCIVIKLND